MKKLLIIFFFIPLLIRAQTSLTFTAIGGGTDVPSYGRGAEQWQHGAWDNTNQGVNMPAGNSVVPPTNYYTRFAWLDIESNTVQGSYSFTIFDQRFHQAMEGHQMFSFGVMPLCVGCIGGEVPTYLHNLMQAEPVLKDWFDNTDGRWIPNWNSGSYLTRYRALLVAIANHIATTSYQPSWSGSPIPYSKVLYQVDIRGFGNYGEWHAYPYLNDAGYNANPNAKPTQTSLDSVIQMNLTVFPNNPNMALIGGFTTQSASFIPQEVSYRLLTATNPWGQIGWRRDNWGDSLYNQFLKYNNESYNPGSGSVALQPLIMNKYKFAPVSGEPLQSAPANGCGSLFCDLLNEVNTYHPAGIGNGNFGGTNASNATIQSNYQTAMRAAGYRLVLTGGSMTTTLNSGGAFNVQIIWSNTGLAPTYDNWNVRLELRNPITHAVVWSGTSTFNPKPLLPGAPLTQNDNFTLGVVANGTYDLYMGVIDPVGYKLNLALAITGRGADGYYPVRTGISVGGAANIPPTARITGTSNVTLPGTAALSGTTSSDPDGTITAYAWSFVSGPNTPTIGTPTASTSTISGLIAGTYVIKLTVTDNQSATGTTNWTINVNNANIPPTAVITPAGTITIQLPTSSQALSGTSSSDPDGTIASYAWSFVSGPNTPTVGTPTASTSTISGMIAGTYVINLLVTDNSGATGTVNKIIVVNAPNASPTAQIIGSSTVQLPASSVALNGSSSFDPDGTITAYAWSTLAGAPNSPTILTPTAVSTTITGLIAGTYNFRLQVTDNAAATGADTITVTVLPAVVGTATTVFTTQTPAGNITGFVSQTPTVPLTNDGQGVNLGVKFRSSVATTVLGVRFYKLAGNNGTHQGELYNSAGTLLASGTFTGETATGWQTLIFASPVSILANTTYVAAYFSPNGTYADNDNYFNAAVTNGTITLLANGTDGPNGVYKYLASPSFPNLDNGFKPNYWVDVVAGGGGTLQNDGQPITLGMKFRSTASVYITGVRFFKIQGNNGVHQGMLYSSSGTLLAQATFTSETNGGWQTVLFSTPVLISPNTTYIVAYFSPLGTYVEDGMYFLTSGVVNGNLTGLQNGTDGVNGLYSYGASPMFPVNTDNGGNYWVDVLSAATIPSNCPGCLIGRIACCKIWVSP